MESHNFALLKGHVMLGLDFKEIATIGMVFLL